MLNAIPDKRASLDLSAGFLKPNEVVGGDHEDEIEKLDGESRHESIDMDERRKSSVFSSKSSLSSGEVPQRDVTVDMGKYILIFS
jgi:hypothetical protein